MPRRIALVALVIVGSVSLGLGLAARAGFIELGSLGFAIAGAVVVAGFAYDYAVRRSRKGKD